MAKFDKESLCQKYFFGITLLRASVKALIHVDFLMYALSKHKHDTYLIENRKKKTWLSSQSYHFVKN